MDEDTKCSCGSGQEAKDCCGAEGEEKKDGSHTCGENCDHEKKEE